MTKQEVETRLREECHLPFYNYKGANKDYSEAEFQEIKAALIKDYQDYVDQYIDSPENDI